MTIRHAYEWKIRAAAVDETDAVIVSDVLVEAIRDERNDPTEPVSISATRLELVDPSSNLIRVALEQSVASLRWSDPRWAEIVADARRIGRLTGLKLDETSAEDEVGR